ncbi:hypothetical protein GCM10022405_44660 [Gibbsiella dentisursi]|uniref:Secreted protein n=1 Tax=Gibbsiella dentisursi TaxID=796890 RepID=A0ABP7M8N2_9GAMM
MFITQTTHKAQNSATVLIMIPLLKALSSAAIHRGQPPNHYHKFNDFLAHRPRQSPPGGIAIKITQGTARPLFIIVG